VGQVPAVLTLVVLAGIGIWGARNHWKLPSFGGPRAAGAASTPPAAGAEAPSSKCARVVFPSAEAVAKVGIEVAPVQVRPMAQYVTATGMVDYEPGLYSRLSSRAAGVVWRVYKEVGERLVKGEVLALIDSGEVGRTKADFLQSLVQARLRAANVQQAQASATRGALSERALLESQAADREARIRLFNAQQALLNLGLPIRLRDFDNAPEEQIARQLRLLGLPAAVRQGLDEETLTANLLPLTAPFDGQVVTRDAAPGEVLQSTVPKVLFTVADVRQLHIDLDVQPEDIRLVRIGQTVMFRPGKGGLDGVTGSVSHISPEVDEKTRRVRVHAQVANPNGRLRPNAFGTGRILVEERPRAVAVPSDALQAMPDGTGDEGSGHVVFVKVADTIFEARRVRPGVREGSYTQVDGVRQGEQVVTAGSYVLKSELLKERIGGGD
jgi:cobalt-zinc-cadmium efflux system membrane fusion protein